MDMEQIEHARVSSGIFHDADLRNLSNASLVGENVSSVFYGLHACMRAQFLLDALCFDRVGFGRVSRSSDAMRPQGHSPQSIHSSSSLTMDLP